MNYCVAELSILPGQFSRPQQCKASVWKASQTKLQPFKTSMKKILFAAALIASTLSAAAPTFAEVVIRSPVVKHHHHRPVCHSVREHGHMVRRCR
jgi:hypothetical protein